MNGFVAAHFSVATGSIAPHCSVFFNLLRFPFVMSFKDSASLSKSSVAYCLGLLSPRRSFTVLRKLEPPESTWADGEEYVAKLVDGIVVSLSAEKE